MALWGGFLWKKGGAIRRKVFNAFSEVRNLLFRGKNAIIVPQDGDGMEQAKKRDHKIMITDIAISKVPYVKVPGLPRAVCEAIKQEHKNILRIAQQENDSNEVLSVWNYAENRRVYVLGSEGYVNPSSSPEAYGIFTTSGKNELCYLHNHPSTQKFSLADIMEFIRYAQIGLMSVVTNQGEVYILYKGEKYSFKDVHMIFSKIYSVYSVGLIDAQEVVSRFLKFCGKGGIVYVRKC